jgi:Fuc2NAc and GlcNAc transferase
VGIVLGSLAGVTAALLSGLDAAPPVVIVLAAAVVVGAIGLIDDVRRLTPGLRLLVQVAAALAVVGTVGPFDTVPLPAPLAIALPAPVAWVLSIIWICAVTNFFNFMDGIDGLAGGQAAASLIGVLLAGWSVDASAVALCVAGATIGFLVHNWAPARIFMGDVGSGFLGFLLATLPLLAPDADKANAVFAAAVGMTLFLADPFETLVRRVAAGESMIQAHRGHTYQQLVGVGESAGRVAAVLVGTGLALAVFGAVAFRHSSLRWPALGVASCAYLIERGLSKRHGRRRVVMESIQPHRQP